LDLSELHLAPDTVLFEPDEAPDIDRAYVFGRNDPAMVIVAAKDGPHAIRIDASGGFANVEPTWP
jgi:hypothetical protein